ncbi:MAG TPA: dihydroneopterin aldolase [Verrucomicrobiota bacterium]|nr:dihydroneopterin aldolase [Verrucomicrobiales bacterium]HRI11678.1 dihydroneopterin aldolase [Verrucomicrobiota bacterium]
MDTITLCDLEVQLRVGVPEAERAEPQRLLLTVEMDHDFAAAAQKDDLAQTINYDAVRRRLIEFGNGRQWKLIETLADELAQMILTEFKPRGVRVEVKKFVFSDARYVSVKVDRNRTPRRPTPAQQLMQKIGGVPAGLR